MSELALHVSVARFLDAALPKDAFWSTIAHGGFRLPISVAKRLRAMGLKKGVPDLFVIHNGRTVFLELKVPGNYPTPEQKAVMANIEQAGGFCFVCRSLEEVADALGQFIPLKLRLT